MKTPGKILLLLLPCFLIIFFFLPPSAVKSGKGGELENVAGERLAQIVLGGLLYDKWYAELELEKPKGTHPAYPETAKGKGASTWRCKECHGWDGRGKDGAYKSGKHFSGIIGVQRFWGGSEHEVVKILKEPRHGYASRIPEKGLRALAAFVTSGQVDMTPFIDGKSKKVEGNLLRGGRLYLTVCARCHGADGKKINFGDESKPKYLGRVARSNPWETLHKIRAGQPDEEMPPMLAFPLQEQVNILAFTLTLPKK